MNCPQKIVTLPCSKSGIGYLSRALECNATTLHLMDGQQANFPDIAVGQHFYVVITTPCNACCATFKVSSMAGNVLSVSATDECPCGCFPSDSKVEYTTDLKEYIKDVMEEVGINVLPPLYFDCATRTLSLRCNELAVLPDCGCGDAG